MREEGEYTCHAENQGGADSMKVKVKVINPDPTSTDPAAAGAGYDLIRVRQGGTMTIRCRAVGEPAPMVTWFSPSNRLIQRGSGFGSERVLAALDGSLEIRGAQRVDGGNYTCRASSAAGVSSRVLGLVVESSNLGLFEGHRAAGGTGGGSQASANTVRKPAAIGNDGGRDVPAKTFSRPATVESYGSAKTVSRLANEGTVGSDDTVIRPATLGSDGSANTVNRPANGGSVGSANTVSRPATGKVSGSSTSVISRLGGSVISVGVSGASNVVINPGAGNTGLGQNGNTGLGPTNISSPELFKSSSTTSGSSNPADSDRSGPVVPSLRQRALKGQTVMLACPSQGSPPPRLSWLLPGIGVLPAPYYGSRLTVHQNGTLELRGVRASDAGTLVCVAAGQRGETQHRVLLEVSETQEESAPHRGPGYTQPPRSGGPSVIQEAPRQGGPVVLPQSPRPGGPVVLPQSPRPGGPVVLPQSPRPGGPVVLPQSPRPGGPVVLPQSPRPGGPVVPPHPPLPQRDPPVVRQQPVVSSRTGPLVSIINGETLRLACSPPRSPQQGGFSWTLPSGEVLSLGHSAASNRYSILEDGSLIVQQASVFDRGSYSCRSTNHDSSSVSVVTTPVIVIAYPPRITTGPAPVTYTRPGVAVELSCLTIATPRATITWQTPDQSQLRVTGQARIYGNRYLSPQGSLVIQNPSSRDTGFYRCTAQNVIGTDSKATYLHVI